MRDFLIQERSRYSEEELLTCHTQVLILAIDDVGEILVLSKPTFRGDQWVLEMPNGDVLYREEPLDAATRVLLTETGMLSDNIEPIGRYVPKGSVIDAVHLFSATDLIPIRSPIKFGYESQLIRLSPNRLSDMIRDGFFQQEAGIKAFTHFFMATK